MKVSAVSSLPLPPKQGAWKKTKFLTSDHPSIAPTPPAPAPEAAKPKPVPTPPKAEPPPKPNEVLIRNKPEPPKPTPTKPAPTKPRRRSR